MKINPRRKPVSQVDVDKAFEKGVNMGVSNASAIFLTVLLDKFGFDENVEEFWDYICKYSEEVGEGRIRISDLKHILLEEYHIRV